MRLVWLDMKQAKNARVIVRSWRLPNSMSRIQSCIWLGFYPNLHLPGLWITPSQMVLKSWTCHWKHAPQTPNLLAIHQPGMDQSWDPMNPCPEAPGFGFQWKVSEPIRHPWGWDPVSKPGALKALNQSNWSLWEACSPCGHPPEALPLARAAGAAVLAPCGKNIALGSAGIRDSGWLLIPWNLRTQSPAVR